MAKRRAQRLADIDLSAHLSNAEYEERLYRAQRRLLELRLHTGGHLDNPDLGPGVLVVTEGSDAGGKGGAIKRVVEPLDPRHYRVAAFAKPTFEEKRRHFLWRFWTEVPLRLNSQLRPGRLPSSGTVERRF